MSRIGRRPIEIPSGVTVTMTDSTIQVVGPNGTLSVPTDRLVKLTIDGQTMHVERVGDSNAARARHGLYWALVQNMIIGTSKGFERRLEMKGVGYRAAKQGNDLVLNLGYSHPITVNLPEGIDVMVEKTSMIVKGIDKQMVGQVAANIRSLRPPEPYKGKGIRYSDEIIRMKAGKAAKAAGAK